MGTQELFPDFEEGTRMTGLGQTWIVGSHLGMGRCAKVYHITTVDGSVEAAAKVFRKEDKYKLVFIKEIRNLDGVAGNSQIVSVYGTFTHKGHPCLIYELLDFSLKELQYKYDHLEVLLPCSTNNNNNQEGVECSKSTNKKAASSSAANQEPSKGLSLFLIQSLYRDLLKCLHHIHGSGWVHADLKPANVMWSAQEGVWKVVDFGHSFEENNQDLSQIQSIGYQSPEAREWNSFICQREQSSSSRPPVQSMTVQEECTSAVDVWSLGCIVAGAFLGRKLYGPEDVKSGGCRQCRNDGAEEKCKCELLIDSLIRTRSQDTSPKFRKVLADLRDLLKQVLQCNPRNRLTASQCLKHRFFLHKLRPDDGGILLPTRVLRIFGLPDETDLNDAAEFEGIEDSPKLHAVL
ncbi:serine/threonine-protein kinase Kist-like isoform X2 [Apostichopus japonicus]|uniref:serine/threonine-protein kinase Kist-like isoform X2 n=1 Tax=Stichopus japonicus TaxID=307972 RepID=UPI003AB15B23